MNDFDPHHEAAKAVVAMLTDAGWKPDDAIVICAVAAAHVMQPCAPTDRLRMKRSAAGHFMATLASRDYHATHQPGDAYPAQRHILQLRIYATHNLGERFDHTLLAGLGAMSNLLTQTVHLNLGRVVQMAAKQFGCAKTPEVLAANLACAITTRQISPEEAAEEEAAARAAAERANAAAAAAELAAAGKIN